LEETVVEIRRDPRVGAGFLRAALAAAAALLPACATTSGQFPSAEELGNLAARPPADRIAADDVADVAQWRLTGPLPDGVAVTAHPPASAWDQLLDQEVSRRAGLAFASESAHCVAREAGLFYLATRGRPAPALEQFIAGRCGLAATDSSTGYRWGDVPADFSDERVLGQWRDAVLDDVGKALGSAGGPTLVGLWYGRKDGRAVVSWLVSRRRVQIDPLPLVPPGAQVVVRGELLIAASHLEGLANAGRFGVHHCIADPAVPLPRFALTCDVDAADRAAQIEVAAFPPGRILGPIVLSLVVWPAGTPGDSFERPVLAGAAPAPCAAGAASGDVPGALTACINQARAEAQLAPLALAPAQSQTATRLAPHFFAALAGAEPELLADKVVLGLRAGWDVGAPLRYGQFTSGLIHGGSAEIDRLVASVLDRPSGREALLDPDARQLAVGTVAGGGGGGGGGGPRALGAVFGTYTPFDGRDDPGDVQRVLQRLADLRARQGRGAPARLSSSVEGDVSAAAHRIASDGRDPTSALNDALEATAARTHGAVRGWWVDADKLDQVELPPEILQAPVLHVAVAVSHYRRKDEPWTRYVVVIVVATPEQTLALRL
jgi:hypothetical protein